jgi:hypothetical protein
MEDFPSNSQQPKKNDKKELKKIVEGEVIKRKQPLGRRVKDIFTRGEFRQAVHFVTIDVFLPAVRDLIVDATSKGVERLVYGDTSPRRRRGHGAGLTTRVAYDQPSRYSSRRDVPVMLPGQPPRGMSLSRRRNTDEIILADRQEAQKTLESLADIFDHYEVATVADLNELLGLPATYTDNNWGWTHLLGAEVVHIREGYLLHLPPVEPIQP